MSVTERDPVSGYATTGHDWNGIKELNSPIPRIVLWFSGSNPFLRGDLLGSAAKLAIDRHPYQGVDWR